MRKLHGSRARALTQHLESLPSRRASSNLPASRNNRWRDQRCKRRHRFKGNQPQSINCRDSTPATANAPLGHARRLAAWRRIGPRRCSRGSHLCRCLFHPPQRSLRTSDSRLVLAEFLRSLQQQLWSPPHQARTRSELLPQKVLQASHVGSAGCNPLTSDDPVSFITRAVISSTSRWRVCPCERACVSRHFAEARMRLGLAFQVR